MTETLSKHQKNLSAIIHASTFSKYLIPFGNFILPLILWTANRKEQEFVDQNGKRALNFQISLFLYSVVITLLTVPFIIISIPEIFNVGMLNFNSLNGFNGIDYRFNADLLKLGALLWPLGIALLAQAGLFIVNIVYTLLAVIRTSEGQDFKYSLTLNFIK
ncbi:MAG TPA: DUF4870 domain-containing protein [Arenibacter sp.]|nr:DUF4870 domain-containing protein [Arenibacter sp.]